MVVSEKQQIILFSIWIVVLPVSIFISWNYLPSLEIEWSNMILLVAIVFATMLLPIKFGKINFSLERWIAFVIFLQYGAFAQLIFMQIAIVILLFTRINASPFILRFIVNSTIFSIVSIVSATFFYLAGGEIGSLVFLNILIFALLYALTYTFFNITLYKFYVTLIKEKDSLFPHDALWDYFATLVILPFSVGLYFLQEFIGNKSIILVAIPFLILLFVARKYNNSNELNDKLQYASDIGRKLADQLFFDEVMETFLIKLKNVIHYDNAYVIDYVRDEKLFPLMGYENESIIKNFSPFISDSTMFIEWDLNNLKIYNSQIANLKLKNLPHLNTTKSAMIVPIKRLNETEGILFLTSSKKNSFEAIDLKIIDILASYFAISLEKARYFEKTTEKSQRCGLTKLNNFRFLDEKLAEEMQRYDDGEIDTLSTIIMDIDYFKKVNDTYGHESGNLILVNVAKILKMYVEPNDILARYGGEEFVILMPNTSKEEAIKRAELIRREIECTAFTIIPDLSDDRSPIEVRITVSIGIANMPVDAKNVKDLMRNADRALYIGGKQAGRNRVGVYEEESLIEMK